nr:unnamed protein product [Callosobruchus analis]
MYVDTGTFCRERMSTRAARSCLDFTLSKSEPLKRFGRSIFDQEGENVAVQVTVEDDIALIVTYVGVSGYPHCLQNPMEANSLTPSLSRSEPSSWNELLKFVSLKVLWSTSTVLTYKNLLNNFPKGGTTKGASAIVTVHRIFTYMLRQGVLTILNSVLKFSSTFGYGRVEIKNNKDEIKLEIQKFAKELGDLRRRNEDLKEQVATLNKKLNAKLTKDIDDKTKDIDTAVELFNSKLKVVCNSTELRDVFRVGHPQDKKSRPVVIELLSSKLKDAILENCKHLKGTGVVICPEYTSSNYRNRKILYQNLKLARSAGLETKIQRNILRIGNEEFTAKQLIGAVDIQEVIKMQLSSSQLEVVTDSRGGIKRKQGPADEYRVTRLKSLLSPVSEIFKNSFDQFCVYGIQNCIKALCFKTAITGLRMNFLAKGASDILAKNLFEWSNLTLLLSSSS